jgi:hypothetical protein
MAKTLSSGSRAGLNWTYTNTVVGTGDVANTNSFNYSATLTSGTAASQADLLYTAQVTVAASGTQDFDLAGSLADAFGATLTFARVKMVIMVPDSTNTASGFKVGLGSNPFLGWFGGTLPTESVDKTGVFFKSRTDVTGWAVTAGTADILRVTNLDGANSLVLNVAVVGASA